MPKNMSLQEITRPAIFHRREIDVAADSLQTLPVGQDFAVNSQARDTTIGIDFEAQMRDALFPCDRKRILRIAGQRHLRQQRHPVDRIALQIFSRWLALQARMLRVKNVPGNCREKSWCQLPLHE